MLFRARKRNDFSRRSYYQAPFFAKPGEVGRLFAYAGFESGIEIEANFAIVDVETSGLQAENSHIIEIAILQISRDGKQIKRFETLVRPPDDHVGRSDIHKIEQSHVLDAPRFSEITGDVLEALSDCILVAHNAKFEEMFLSEEFKRAGITVPTIPAIDTMWLAQMGLDLSNYKLATVVESFGYKIQGAHTAYGDIEAVSKFLPELLESLPELKYPGDLNTLPDLPTGARVKTR